MSNNNSRFVLDRPGSGIRSSIVYDTSNAINTYTTASLSQSMTTAATSRIGLSIVRNLPPSRSFESSGVGGKRIGVVTLFNVEESINEGNDTRNLDAFRTGKNIKTYKHFSSNVFRPMIRVSPESFFEEEKGDVINHYASFNSFGFGMFYKTVDENYKLIPVQDFSSINYGQFLDPSHPHNDGAIDVFEVRRSIANLSTSDISIHGFKADLMAGGISDNKKGGTLIESKIDLNQSKIDTISLYDDAQDTLFSDTQFVTRNKKGTLSNDKSFPLPGYVDAGQQKLSPFFEDVNYITGSYSFAGNNNDMVNFLSSSRNRMSEIGSRFKSSTCGLIFGESNSLGTDSIAFGGLKK